MLELGVVPSIQSPIVLYCDNNGVVANVREPRCHKRSKHIEKNYHLILDIVQRGDIDVVKVASVDNLTDSMTNTLSQKVFDAHIDNMGVRLVHEWLSRQVGDC